MAARNCRNSKGTLSPEQNKMLIQLVKRRPCIWNTDDEEYNDRSITARAWMEIAQQIRLPEDLIRAKWKNLRDLYIREVKRMHVTDVDDYRGKWKHFKQMCFLYKSSSGDQSDGDSEPAEAAPEPYIVKIEPSDVEYMYLESEQTHEVKAEKRKRKDKPSSDPVDVSETMYLNQEPLDKRNRNKVYTDEDCDMMFLKSLVPYFRDLKPIRKLVLRNKIQEMLLNEIA